MTAASPALRPDGWSRPRMLTGVFFSCFYRAPWPGQMQVKQAGMAPAWRPAPQIWVSPVPRVGVFSLSWVEELPEPKVSASLAMLAGVFSQAWAQAWVQGLPVPLIADLTPLTVPAWVAA